MAKCHKFSRTEPADRSLSAWVACRSDTIIYVASGTSDVPPRVHPRDGLLSCQRLTSFDIGFHTIRWGRSGLQSQLLGTREDLSSCCSDAARYMQTILIKSEDIAAKSPETEQRKSFRVAVSGFGVCREVDCSGSSCVLKIIVPFAFLQPFQNVPVNPSWQCLKPLQKAKLLTTAGAHVILACTEVSVTYEDVERYALRSHLEQVSYRRTCPFRSITTETLIDILAE